jgi:hypothetical protein
MTVTPRRTATRTSRGRGRRAGPPIGAGRHTPAVRVRPRHAARPADDVVEIAPPEPADGRRGARRAPIRRRPGYLRAALLRCAVYLGPLSVAVAAGGPLAQVAWPVPVITLLLGWAGAQALTSVGVATAQRSGTAAACRLVGGGFAALAGIWCALVWVAPDDVLGPHRGLALVVGLGGLATLATVTAALVTRAEVAIVRWHLPCWLLAVAALAALAGEPVPGLPVDTLLPAAIVVSLIRAFRPALLPGGPRRSYRLFRPELRRAAGHLIIGASQAVCVGVLWQAGPDGSTAPFWLTLLIAVPILETLIGWHTDQVEAGQVRGVTLVTLAGLLPPFAMGCALAVAADRLPTHLAVLGDARASVLGLAGGTLLGGVFAITFLLAARGRTAVAATLAAAPLVATAALKLLPISAAGPLPNAVGALAAAHLAGLLVVALTAADHRRRS